MPTNNVQVDINMLKLLYLAELIDINIKYIASNTSVMMSLSIGYPQILASGYPDSKFTIRFSPNLNQHLKCKNKTTQILYMSIFIYPAIQYIRMYEQTDRQTW